MMLYLPLVCDECLNVCDVCVCVQGDVCVGVCVQLWMDVQLVV